MSNSPHSETPDLNPGDIDGHSQPGVPSLARHTTLGSITFDDVDTAVRVPLGFSEEGTSNIYLQMRKGWEQLTFKRR